MAISNPTPLFASPHIEGNNGNFNSFTTSNFTPTANALLLVGIAASNSNNPATPETLVVTHNIGNTGTLAVPANAAQLHNTTVDGYMEVWVAQVGASPTAGAITVTTQSGSNLTGLIVCPLEVTSHNSSSPVVQAENARNFATTISDALPATPATDSLVIAFVNARGETVGLTPGSGFTERVDARIGTGVPWLNVQYKNGNSDGTYGWTDAHTAGNYYVALEIAAGVTTIEGNASITLADASVAATSTLQIAGSSSVTLGDSTLSATGTLTLAGSAALTLDGATGTATGTVAISGASSITLESATATATGTLALSGTLTATLANATTVATGTVLIAGTASLTLDNATLEGSGVIGDVPLVGTLAVTLDDATVDAGGALTIAGTANATLDDATGSATATLSIGASATITLADATLIATATNEGVVAYVTYTMQVEVLTMTTAQVEVF